MKNKLIYGDNLEVLKTIKTNEKDIPTKNKKKKVGLSLSQLFGGY